MNNEVYVYLNIWDQNLIVGYFEPQNKRTKASIEDIREHDEIWEGKLHVREGIYQYEIKIPDYVKIG